MFQFGYENKDISKATDAPSQKKKKEKKKNNKELSSLCLRESSSNIATWF